MAQLDAQFYRSLRRCLDDCARETRDDIHDLWHRRATANAPVDSGEYRQSFVTSKGGANGHYTGDVDNLAPHASFVELGSEGWTSRPGKYYRFNPPTSVLGHTEWIPYTPESVFHHPGTPRQEIIEESLRYAIVAYAS